MTANGHIDSHMSNSCGWFGDHESDIPISLFPKHVAGLHVNGDMAFHKDFESIEHLCQMAAKSNLPIGVPNGNAYPDVVNGGGGNVALLYFLLTNLRYNVQCGCDFDEINTANK